MLGQGEGSTCGADEETGLVATLDSPDMLESEPVVGCEGGSDLVRGAIRGGVIGADAEQDTRSSASSSGSPSPSQSPSQL